MIERENQTDYEEFDELFGTFEPFREEDCYQESSNFFYSDINPFRWIFKICQNKYSGINIDPKVLGGIPRIAGTRISVTQILSRVRVLGSVQAVAKYYEPFINEDQVKEALSYAQSFMELAGDPYQPYD